jgi:hypothetical protein
VACVVGGGGGGGARATCIGFGWAMLKERVFIGRPRRVILNGS